MPRCVTTSPEEHRTLADSLAVDRTLLANERTGLAYLRTALGIVLGGLAVFRFFERQRHDVYEMMGILALVGAAVLAWVGIRNFRNNQKTYRTLYAHMK